MTAALPLHAECGDWPIEDDCLVVGGLKLTELASRIASTPFHAYGRRLRQLPAAVKFTTR